MLSNLPVGNIVKDFYDGATHIVICDDFVEKDPEKSRLKKEQINDRIISIYIKDRLDAFRKEHNLSSDAPIEYALVDPEDISS